MIIMIVIIIILAVGAILSNVPFSEYHDFPDFLGTREFFDCPVFPGYDDFPEFLDTSTHTAGGLK